ncbi:MAG: ATP-dependent helicase HrpB [Geminicoccaceae bacterium]|nr:ATP-dependent helicase HrpB [Geminicoccaceae bacterium]
MRATLPDLPVKALLPELERALERNGAAVLVAPPGAGKSTLVPLGLSDAPWLAGGRIWMLQPRRLAARLVARRMADLLGEPLGETIGYAVRFERIAGPRTRIEVLTEGLLLRRLQRDPELSGVGLVILDEVHERALESDLALALLLEVRQALRPDLRLLAASATLDGERLSRLLGGAPILRAEGRAFPVETRYRPPPRDVPFATHVAAAVREALASASGDVLVFLPGAREIRAVARELADLPSDLLVLPLFGDLARTEQDRALAPAPAGRRKIVLATDIAETSLTVEGVRAVVDGGFARRPRFDPRTGTSRLVTLRVSLASAEQRRGRAGRLAPGLCVRLWARAEERAMAPFDRPEILDADLAPLALELARWGVREPARLAWLDPPPEPAFSAARELLRALGALDADGRITPEGAAMAELPLHPRLARLLLEGRRRGLGPTAAALAALLSARDPWREDRDPDLAHKLRLMCERAAGEPSARAEVERVRRELARCIEAPLHPLEPERAGTLLAFAFPDRIARARPGADGRFLLASGRGCRVEPESALARAPFIAVAELDDAGTDARVHAAAALAEETVRELAGDAIARAVEVFWDDRARAVVAREVERLGAILLASRPLPNPDPDAVRGALLEGVRRRGLDRLPWTPRARALRARIAWLARREPALGLPDVSHAALERDLDRWLGPRLEGLGRWEELAGLDLEAALAALLDPRQRAELDRLAPPALRLPSGRTVAIDYDRESPTVRVRAQELFGLDDHPRLCAGREPLVFEILSPADRPIAITRDLPGFWRNGWAEVRKTMRGRYPKHPWPEEPWRPLGPAGSATARRTG